MSLVQSLAVLAAVGLAAPIPASTAPSFPSTNLKLPPGGSQELAALKEQILSNVAKDLDAAWRSRDLEQSYQGQKNIGQSYQGQKDLGQQLWAPANDMKKRMFVPLSGLPGELPTIKRQIRYHQCYFNPISCFRK